MFLGMGDYHDFLSPSNRKYLRTAGLYDTATELIEEWHREHLEGLKKILEPTKGRWLGLLEGHHFYEYADGTTTDTDLCKFLDAPFLGTCAMLVLTFVKGKARACCTLWAHHGTGGGSTPGAPFNTLNRLMGAFPQVDIFLMGHTTKQGHVPMDALEVWGEPPKLRDRTRSLVLTGGFMRGYQQGSKLGKTGRAQGSYVEKAMMVPTALGGPLIYVTPRDRHGAGLDIKVST